MLSFSKTFTLPELGKCRTSIAIEANGYASVEVAVDCDTPDELTSKLVIPPALLHGVFLDMQRLLNLERARAGLEPILLAGEDDEDEDD